MAFFIKSTYQKKHSIIIVFVFFVISSCSTDYNKSEKEIGGSTIMKSNFSRPLTDVKFESTSARIERGRYLVEGTLYCFICHTERDKEKPGWPPFWEKKGSGRLIFKADSTHLYSSNITPDKATGIGDFTDDMIARAIREGIGHDDRGLTFMPWHTYRELTDEDVASIVVFLRTIPAIKNEIPSRNLGRRREENITKSGYPLNITMPEPNIEDQISRGKYLIRVADCIGCHTHWNKRNPGVFGGGNFGKNEEKIFSTNISSSVTGIGGWSAETFIYVMKSGKDGVLNHLMPWTSFKNMTDEDLEAIFYALKTTYPVKHYILNGPTPTYCEVCEQEHGFGDQNKLETLQPFDNDYKIPKDLAGDYYNQMFDKDTVKVYYNEGKLTALVNRQNWELIPVSETYYFSNGIFAPLRFIRHEEGHVTDLEFQVLGRSTHKKVK